MLQHKPKPKPKSKHVDVRWLEVIFASRSVPLDLSCSQLSFPSTQKYVLTYFSKNPSKK